MALEALNHIGHDKKMIVILNDNEMSIAPNVGAIHRYLSSYELQEISMVKDQLEILIKKDSSCGGKFLKQQKD